MARPSNNHDLLSLTVGTFAAKDALRSFSEAGLFSMATSAFAAKDAALRNLCIHSNTHLGSLIVLTDTSEDEVREMFLRLQNGTSLKAQEKRNAMPGKMRTFIKDLAQHPFFSRCNFANSRFTHDLVAAQMTAIELNGGPCHVRNSNLNAM